MLKGLRVRYSCETTGENKQTTKQLPRQQMPAPVAFFSSPMHDIHSMLAASLPFPFTVSAPSNGGDSLATPVPSHPSL